MKHYILTSSKFAGSVQYKYCDEGFLVWFQYDAAMSDAQRIYTLQKMPLTLQGFQDLMGTSKTVKIEEVMPDLSFDAFWNAYDKKINRKRCEPLWNKLKDHERMQCLKSIPQYVKYLTRTNYRAKKDPDGYLRDRLFETEWHRLWN